MLNRYPVSHATKKDPPLGDGESRGEWITLFFSFHCLGGEKT